MIPLQIPGGPELLILFLVYGLMGFVPLALAAAAIYLLYRIRQDTKSIATSLERIAARRASPADAGRGGTEGGSSPSEAE